jgi:lauroyl/myristoyl acyltransferase
VRLPARPVDLYFALVTALMESVRMTGSLTLGRLFSKAAATAAYGLSPVRRRQKERALALAFGSLERHEARRIVTGSFLNFWEDLFLELGVERPERKGGALLEGEEHLDAALVRGNGAILWESNSFGRRALAKEILASHGHRLVQLHIENHLGGLHNDGLDRSWLREKVLNRCWEAREMEYLEEIIRLPRDGSLAYARTLRHRLRANKIICSAADGNWGEKTMATPFLGGVRHFSTGMVSLSRLTGAPLMPLFCYRETDGRFRVRIDPPLAHPPRIEREEATRRTLAEFARLLESCVKDHPEQYHAWHNVPGERERI